ncbi:Alpha/beta hydrolase family protein [Gemmata obscuriglobus]|uniref:Esterase n=1 Tax=Gemmata obscuriglobus TaxID=114 RepID=A0A2Z3GST5_9BACT|nr:prolyl oligopeptidase family serine peptidase [Gemmata obscuriglobus]AWM36833.1 esterase [Gemmata obscuriglobus]QEG30497.1 Alpha/beta hydrolase family protein [Gemmata obscuriglobus]VTS09821.1 Putative PHB depolymerase OS=Chthoniobacter flavus Ellin428 GN=CfE428DRAFT_4802 PE=4 SV=1: Abhydrolase_5 [Gemmata obscuriglobus UQM 2246]
MFLRSAVMTFTLVGLVTGSFAAQPEGKADNGRLKSRTWKVGDVTREALVYAPAVTGTKRPLVFVFHGHGGKSELSARSFAIHKHWPEAVCVYPQGLPTAVPVLDPMGRLPGWQKFVGDQKDRDLEFFDAMLKSLVAEESIDEKRVYSTGHSNGGFFTYVLCAARHDKLAAAAPVAGAINPRDAMNMKPLPVLHVAGEKDKIVPFATQEKTMDQLRKLNKCDEKGKEAGRYCTQYTSTNGPPVVTFIHPGAHNVPAGAPERIVEFLKLQTRK